MLGFETPSVEGQATPDAVWLARDSFALVFEAKSDESENDPISVRTVRQARTHETWARKECELSDEAAIHTIIVTPRSTVASQAKTYGAEMFAADLDTIRELGEDAAEALRRIRALADSTDVDHAVP